jgi:hypothetical protein
LNHVYQSPLSRLSYKNKRLRNQFQLESVIAQNWAFDRNWRTILQCIPLCTHWCSGKSNYARGKKTRFLPAGPGRSVGRSLTRPTRSLGRRTKRRNRDAASAAAEWCHVTTIGTFSHKKGRTLFLSHFNQFANTDPRQLVQLCIWCVSSASSITYVVHV